MIEASQLRAARGLIEWSQTQLAEASGLSLPTIKRMEKIGPSRSAMGNVSAVVVALQDAGVIFLDDGAEATGGPGVRLRKDRPE